MLRIRKRSFLSRLLFWKQSNKILNVPTVINRKLKGLYLNKQMLKSIFSSTDLALIEDNNCDVILAAYPFPSWAKIMKSLIQFSHKPVIFGIGERNDPGKTALNMAVEAEQLGVFAVIVNQPFKNLDILKIKRRISIPIISSVSSLNFNFKERFESEVSFFNITGGKKHYSYY